MEQQSVVRAKIAGLIGILAKTPTINVTVVEQDLQTLLKSERK